MPGTGVSGSRSPNSRFGACIHGRSERTGWLHLSANDYVSVEVFGEDDLRTSGRLNPEGNVSVPLLGSIHLGGLTLTPGGLQSSQSCTAAIIW